MVTDHLQERQAHLWWMVAASEPRLKDLVPLAEPPRYDCSEEECNNEEEIPHPSAKQVAARLQPSMAPSNAIASTSTSNAGAPHPHPEPLLEALTIKFIRCAKKEKLLTSRSEEELLVTHGLTGKTSMVCSCVSSSFNLYTQLYKDTSPNTGELMTNHSIFQELSDFFRTSEALEAANKEMWIQDRWVSTNLLTTSPTDTINPELLKYVGFDPEKAPATILSAFETMSETEDSKQDSDQESARTDGHQATAVWYIQLHPKAIETGQASKKHCPRLTKPSTSLATLTAAGSLHLPIDNAKAGWLNWFLTNMDIPSNICPKHQ